MNSPTQSVKTRSVVSATSSRSSIVRREAGLAKLRLEQQRKQDELERQLQEAESRRRDLERQLRDSALANEVERLELEAELIEQEEAEASEVGLVRDGRGGSSRGQSSEAAGRLSLANQPLPDAAGMSAADRTGRWVKDLSRRAPSPEKTPQGSWIDRLDSPIVPEAGQPVPMCTATTPSPLPKLALERFSGDPLHWPRWSALFKSLVHDRRELSDAERLTHLQTCLEGPARDAVSGLLCDGSLYGEALRELQQQFGDSTAVVRSSLQRVLQLPPVMEHSPTELAELSRALHATVSVLKMMGYHADLAATTNVAAVVAKAATGTCLEVG